MTKITKAVIPCGGMGTRFMPITKAVPKEILPVIDTPVLAYIVDEAIESGITDIMIVLSPGKDAIKNYFSQNIKLEETLLAAGKTELAQLLRRTHDRANIVFAYQNTPKGSGDAVLKAEKFTGNEPFCLSWGDDLIFSKVPVMRQLMDAYVNTEAVTLGVQSVMGDDITKYGVVKISESKGRLHRCAGIVEKPSLDKIPSRLAGLGRYVLTGGIYESIKNISVGLNNELQLTDALNYEGAVKGNLYAYEFEGKRYDMGDKFGSVQATVEYALRNPEYGSKVKSYIMELADSLKGN